MYVPVSCLIVISEGQELLCGSRGCANVPEAVTLAQSQHLGYLAVRTGLRQRFLRPMTTGRTLLVARGTTSTRPMFAFGDGHAVWRYYALVALLTQLIAEEEAN